MKIRELKFRVWDEKYRCWDHHMIICYPEQPFLHQGRIFQQFTGYKDDDGKEIYEGDIVNRGGTVNSLVRWSMSGGCWEDAPLDKNYAPGFNIDEEDYLDYNGFDEASLAFGGGNGYNGPIKVIGNIFENPELLK